MKSFYKILFVIITCLTTSAWAGTVTTSGTGTVSGKAETATFATTIISSCYVTAEAATNANNSVSNSVKGALSDALELDDGCVGRVTTFGLSLQRTLKDKNIEGSCTGWSATNGVKVAIENIATSEDVSLEGFAAEKYTLAINTAIDAIKSLPVENVSSPVKSITTSSYGPLSFGLADATRNKLEQDALKLAIEDAIRSRDTFLAECKQALVKGNDLNEATASIEAVYSSSPRMGYARSFQSSEAVDSTPAVSAADIPVTATVSIVWNVENTEKCETPATK